MGFYPHDGRGSVLEHVKEATARDFIVDPTGLFISHEVALRAGDALLNTIFLESRQEASGALHYNQLTEGQLETIGEAAERQPGEEFALVFAPEGESMTEKVRQFGAKSEVTYEAVKRNDLNAVSTLVDFLSLTIHRKLDEYALDILAKLADAGLSVETVVPILTGATTRDSAPANTTVGTIAQAVAVGAESDLSLSYDTLIPKPTDITLLRMEERVTGLSLEDDFGVTVKPSRSLEPATGYLVDSSRAGEVFWEDGMTSEVIDDKERHVHIVQAWATPAAAITTPAAVNKLSFAEGV